MLANVQGDMPVVIVGLTFNPEVRGGLRVYHLANSRLLNKTNRSCFNGLTLFDVGRMVLVERVWFSVQAPRPRKTQAVP